MTRYEIEFYEDEHGDNPVLRWLREELSPRKRRALGTAMNRVLQVVGVGVCGTEYGRQLGKGLFEFRLGGADLAKVVPGSGPADPQGDRPRPEAPEGLATAASCGVPLTSDG